ncbi:hypothetical protein ACLOJK_039008 [Asimina triloba]
MADVGEASTSRSKKVIVIGIDSSSESLYSLEWTIEHLIPSCESHFRIILVHVKVPALSILRFSGPGVGDVVPLVEKDIKKTAGVVTQKAKEYCESKSVDDFEVEVVEGDARNSLCEAVDKHHADILVVGSHGYGAFKR